MSSFLSSGLLTGLGQGFSIGGLALTMPFCFIFKAYLRFLDHLQLFYVFAFVLAADVGLFSNNLLNSWVAWDKNIFVFCTSGQLVCTAGFPLSFGACLLLFLIIMRLIVAIESCRKKDIRFEPVYTFFKGLTRWIYAPLSYWSVYFLIQSITGTSDSLYSSIAILAIVIVYPLAQLIGYKLIQTQKDLIWRKWLQFLNFYRLLIICGLMAIAKVLSNNTFYYIIFGVYAVYGIIYTIKHNFRFKVVGRIVFVLGQSLMITCFAFFLFKQDYLINYSLDFLCFAGLFLMDIIYHIAEAISFYRNGTSVDTDSQKVTPQATDERPVKEKKKKGNSYEIDLNENDNQFNNSRQKIEQYEVPSYTKIKTKPSQSPKRK